MYPAAIMQQPITTIVLIIIVSLLNSYFYRIPTTSTGLAAPAPDHPLEARPVSDINYRAIGSTAGRTLATFRIFHSTSSFPLNFSLTAFLTDLFRSSSTAFLLLRVHSLPVFFVVPYTNQIRYYCINRCHNQTEAPFPDV